MDKRVRDLEDAIAASPDDTTAHVPYAKRIQSKNSATCAFNQKTNSKSFLNPSDFIDCCYTSPSPTNSDGSDGSVASTPHHAYELIDLELLADFEGVREEEARPSGSGVVAEAFSPHGGSRGWDSGQRKPSIGPCVPPPAAQSKPGAATELSDEDLISMLAECVAGGAAAGRAHPVAVASGPSLPCASHGGSSTGVATQTALVQGDAEIMNLFESCAAPFQVEGASAFQLDDGAFVAPPGESFEQAEEFAESMTVSGDHAGQLWAALECI